MPSRSLTMGNLGRERARCAQIPPVLRLLVLATGLAWGCGATPRSGPVAPPAASPEPLDEPFAGSFGTRELSRVPAIVSLPDARAWHASTSGTFTLLEHGATHSRLTLRVTLAPRLVRPEQCLTEARLARPSLPGPDDGSSVEQRTIGAPAGFDVRLVVGVAPARGGVHGYALAFGAATSRCYVAVYETDADGEQAAKVVAERLAIVVSGVLETLRVPSAEGRVPPPPGVE